MKLFLLSGNVWVEKCLVTLRHRDPIETCDITLDNTETLWQVFVAVALRGVFYQYDREHWDTLAQSYTAKCDIQ